MSVCEQEPKPWYVEPTSQDFGQVCRLEIWATPHSVAISSKTVAVQYLPPHISTLLPVMSPHTLFCHIPPFKSVQSPRPTSLGWSILLCQRGAGDRDRRWRRIQDGPVRRPLRFGNTSNKTRCQSFVITNKKTKKLPFVTFCFRGEIYSVF